MLTSEELAEIRTAVPRLDAMALRALRRFGYDVVRVDTHDGIAASTTTTASADAAPILN